MKDEENGQISTRKSATQGHSPSGTCLLFAQLYLKYRITLS